MTLLLHVTQPTLPRQLSQSEAELGGKLFDRGQHGIVLTEDGLLLRRRALEIVALADKTERELSHADDLLSGEITIGSGETKNIRVLIDMMAAFRAAHPEVTALVCNGDMVALGASLALIEDGLLPGREVSIIGFDDIQDACLASPPLTTMAISPYQMGRKLARALLDRLKEPEAPPSITLFPATLVVRGTTGPPIA